ncbi:alpha/beta hydrolase family esterase [Caldimonas tepidiphila]|uniref:extracellular catalytic domain type 1 short-chain-length polyhydroxyalkanoate depolymerase n=1 Tax=Caldimonas tepidiphila TaxID=2315841 RepID=UPI000E5C3E5C|nr:PHB depolymerase family esterase [Caldimonas tepidiphila]
MKRLWQRLTQGRARSGHGGALARAGAALRGWLRGPDGGERRTPAPPAAPAGGASPAANADSGPGRFIENEHEGPEGRRRYRLYLPPGPAAARPLLVLLHGCKQDPEDFAAGTRMNELAREHGVCVLYPEQSRRANPMRCWNWFQPRHQQRGQGEPALLAGLVEAVLAQHGLDARRTWVAGLSAGGSMAAILAQRYPERFAALGVHSGLPCGSAHDVSSAFSVMREGVPSPHAPISRLHGAAQPLHAPRLPTIVFHGDADDTVHPRNGRALVEAALPPGALAQVEHGRSLHGRRYTRTVFRDAGGTPRVEHWELHSGGHAWSGGDAAGSYTDPAGPEASRELLRFFLAQ